MSSKVDIQMEDLVQRIKETELPEVDLIIGIATGGIVPASLLAYKTGKPFRLITINYRDENNNPRYDDPKLLDGTVQEIRNKRILLVDDVSVSGKTFDKAKELLSGNSITTFVMKGKGDYVMFPEVNKCVNWPWKT